jgi:hypothetical protein
MKKRTVLKYVDTLPIKMNLNNINFNDLRAKAIEFHNKKMSQLNIKGSMINSSTSRSYINTAIISYVRHEYTNYEVLLERIDKRLGDDKITARTGKDALKEKINDLIAQKLDIKTFYRHKIEKKEVKQISFTIEVK